MMITIHGFPAKTKFQDVKMLLKQECNINDFILDNLISDTDGTKKVRIGLADNTEGYKVIKCLDGYRMPGNFILKAVPIGKAATVKSKPLGKHGVSLLLDLISKHEVVTSKTQTHIGNKLKEEAWKEIAQEFTTLGGEMRRPDQLKLKWENLKKNARKRATLIQNNLESSQPPQESSFDSRPGYQNQSRNDYPNAPRNDYMGPAPNDYNNQGAHGPGAPLSHGGIHGSVGPHGPGALLSHGGIHGSVGSHAPVGPHGPRPSPVGPHSHSGPQGSMDNRPMPWVSGGGNNANQWNAPMANQVPQNTFGFNSPQANVNASYGQQPHQSHSRPPFNQVRAADQGYGYTPKNVPEVVSANPRYRWVRKAEPEPKDHKSPHPDEDSPSPSSVDDLDETSQDVLDDLDKQDPGETSNKNNSTETTKSKKARKREQAKLRNINNLTGAKRRRLFFWLKQGKTFMEARELCETRHNRIPEYPAAKAEKKRRAREIALRRMSPERQARAIKVDRLKGRGIPGAPPPEIPPGQPIRVRILDELGLMSQEKIEMIEDKILELIDAETDGNGPSFVGYMPRSGSLILSCANTQTLEWLENHLPDLHQWEGANIKIVNLSELPKPVIGVAYIADPDLDDRDILNMLQSHNEGIDFSDWWITGKKPENSAGQTVTFSIDKFSVDKLAERNNFVYLGVKKIKIRLRFTNANAPPGQGMMPPMKQLGKGMGKMCIPPNPPVGQKGKGPKGKMWMPSNPRIGQNSKGPKGKMGVGPMVMGSMGMGPIGPMGMGPIGPMDMGPMEQPRLGPMGMGPMGPMGMGPMNPMGMGPMGPIAMGPMNPMGMGPMGPMNQMGMGPMGPMGQMGFYSSTSNSEMYDPPQGSSYASGFSKQKHFGGGNQPKHFKSGNQPNKYGWRNEQNHFGGRTQPKNFGGGGKHSKKKTSEPVNNNSGPNPQQGNALKKLSPSKAKRNKERMKEYLTKGKNPGSNLNAELP